LNTRAVFDILKMTRNAMPRNGNFAGAWIYRAHRPILIARSRAIWIEPHHPISVVENRLVQRVQVAGQRVHFVLNQRIS
ncbi:MAG: hypothetical protein AB2813_03910, partial [Candidatus Sedimenticola endophacoides]